jgi:hypothetical protein
LVDSAVEQRYVAERDSAEARYAVVAEVSHTAAVARVTAVDTVADTGKSVR